MPEPASGDEGQQLVQLRSYLCSLAGQLQFAFDAVEREQVQMTEQTRRAASAAEKTPAEVFGGIKSLIIKSADVVEKLSQETERRLTGRYVARSEFGTYMQQTEQRITENSQGITQSFRDLQQILSEVQGLQSAMVEVNAYIRTGLLYETAEGTPIYGLEIGQQEHRDGAITFRRFARLVSDRLSFYDSSDVEVAYISDRALHITTAEVNSLNAAVITASRSLTLGDYHITVNPDGHLTVN